MLVYGTNDKAVATASRLRGSKRYEVVGLISKDPQILHTLIADQRSITSIPAMELGKAVR